MNLQIYKRFNNTVVYKLTWWKLIVNALWRYIKNRYIKKNFQLYVDNNSRSSLEGFHHSLTLPCMITLFVLSKLMNLLCATVFLHQTVVIKLSADLSNILALKHIEQPFSKLVQLLPIINILKYIIVNALERCIKNKKNFNFT